MSAPFAATVALRCTLGLAGPAFVGPAFAATEERPVAADAAGCPDRWQAAWREVLRVELGPRLVDGPRPGEPIDQVTVACEAERAIITARPATGEAPVVHALSLAGIPEDAGPRLVALLAIELVTTRPRPLAAVTPPPAAVAVAPVAPAPAPSRVLLGGGPRVFLAEGGLVVWGGALRWQQPVRAGWGAVLDLDVGASAREVAQGRLSALLGSIGGALQVAHGSLETGVGGRLGFARLAGDPVDKTAAGRAVVRPWAGPFAFAALVLGRRRLCGVLAVEAGYAAVGTRGLVGDAVVSAAAGPWLGLSLSGGLRQ